MEEVLKRKLHQYLVQNNLDLLLALQESSSVTYYLDTKVEGITDLLAALQKDKRPEYVIQALCLEELTKELRPSKFSFVQLLLEEEFDTLHWQLRENGTLTYEIINIIRYIKPIMERMNFSEETEDSKELRHEVIGAIREYFSGNDQFTDAIS